MFPNNTSNSNPVVHVVGTKFSSGGRRTQMLKEQFTQTFKFSHHLLHLVLLNN